MLPYLTTGLIAYLAAILSVFNFRQGLVEKAGIILFAVAIILFIGFRYEVGKDWDQYGFILRSIRNLPAYEGIVFTDPGYSFINIVSGWLNFEVSFVFLICAAILVAGIVMVALRTPFAWLAIAATMPHIVTVMSMDHVRQATALGCILIGISYLMREKNLHFLFWVAAAILFHRTSIVVLALGVISISRNRNIIIPMVLAAMVVMAQSIYAERLEIYAERYLEGGMESRGALFRLGIAALPAAGYLLMRRRFDLSPPVDRLMTFMSIGAIGALLVLPLSPSAVIIDRIAKYFLPLQLIFWPYLVASFPKVADRIVFAILAVGFLAATHAFWLLQSELAELYWIPYRTVLWT